MADPQTGQVHYELGGVSGVFGELRCGAGGNFSVLKLEAATDEDGASLLRAKVIAAAAFGVVVELSTYAGAAELERVTEQAQRDFAAAQQNGGALGRAADEYPSYYPKPPGLLTVTITAGRISIEVGVRGGAARG